MSSYRFVLDTSVIVSAVLFRQSVVRQAFEKALLSGKILQSSPTIEELNTVFRRRKFDKYVREERRLLFLNDLIRESLFVEVITCLSACRDPKDDKFLELAIDGQADCIISSDDDLLTLHPHEHIPILSPRDFLETDISSLDIPELARYGQNLTRLAKQVDIAPQIEERDTQHAERVIRILQRRIVNNATLIDGTTQQRPQIVQHVAYQLAHNENLPEQLIGKEIVSLNTDRLFEHMQTYIRIAHFFHILFDKLYNRFPYIILYITDIDRIIGCGEDVQYKRLVYVALVRGEIQGIFSMTKDNYKRCIEPDGVMASKIFRAVVLLTEDQ